MTDIDDKTKIRAALSARGLPLAEDARAFFAALGYESKRTMPGEMTTAEFLTKLKLQPGLKDGINEDAFRECVKSAAVVSQFGDDEVAAAVTTTGGGLGLDGGKFQKGDMHSFIFVAIDLKPRKAGYGRGLLARITRAVNRRLAMPAAVFFRHQGESNNGNGNKAKGGRAVTLSFVHRRAGAADKTRDIIGRVSMLRAISRETPHRGHLDILGGLTIQSRMQWIAKNNKTPNFETLLAAWLDALDIEELNRNFYADLVEWFKRAAKESVFPDTLPASEHITRLLTRLLFVWFMKEKGLVAGEWFMPAEVRALLKNFNNGGGDYYRAVLQNLFFATLNAKIESRGFSSQRKPAYRVSTLYRYRSLIADESRFLSLMKQTPFVNGGLFDCLDKEHHKGERVDMFSDPDPKKYPQERKRAWDELSVPDDLFFNDKHGLIRIFNGYKFTVQENTPVEQEVALDPELLGKVFEDLLDWIIKKQTGSYYTPRTIVDYMADESIGAAIAGKCCAPNGRRAFVGRIRALLDYGIDYENDKRRFDDGEAADIVRAIADIKVLDPAVGSGAFPMGVLHKLTLALRRLDPNNAHWKQVQIARAQKRAARAFDEQDNKEERKRELTEINDIFDRYKDSDYGRKLYLIQNSIFGVDIQPVACQIAKLRFFISLAIEQEANDNPRDNFGIKPLPNLETRLVAADTLMPLYSGQSILTSEEAKQIERQLAANRERHFHATDYEAKKACRKEDGKLRNKLKAQLIKDNMPGDSPQKIAAWNPYDQNTAADWFNAEYMFGVDGGFDIVIGNPPYVDSENMIEANPQQREAIAQKHKTAKGNWDLYIPFIERGMLLADKGTLSFIVPNKLLSHPYAQSARKFLSLRRFVEIRDYSNLQVFAAAVYPITFVVTGDNSYEEPAKAIRMKTPDEIGQRRDIDANFFRDNKDWSVIFESASKAKILDKMNGVKTRYTGRFENPASVSDAYKIKELVLDCEHCPESKKLVNSGAIDGYVNFWGKKATRYLGDKYLFPRVKNANIIDTLSPKRWQESCAPKIIIANMTPRRLEAFMDSGAEFIAGKSTVMYISGAADLKIMLAILNSRLVSFWYKTMFRAAQMGEGLQVTQNRLNQLKMPNISTAKKADFIRLADNILAAKADNPAADTSQWEAEIDELVYALYGLSDEEIAIVEGHGS